MTRRRTWVSSAMRTRYGRFTLRCPRKAATPAETLAPVGLRFEVVERVDAQGNVLLALDLQQVEKLLPQLLRHLTCRSVRGSHR